jgi:hypothetical protein
MKNSFWIIVSALIVLGILSAGCTSTTTTANTPVQTLSTIKPAGTTTTTVTTAQDDLTLVESHVETGDYGARYVVGTVKSNVNKQFTYVQVTINEYDSSGAQVGSTLANTNNLEPYGTWKFKAYVLDKDATDFKVMKITTL